jgi:hypothetical protein
MSLGRESAKTRLVFCLIPEVIIDARVSANNDAVAQLGAEHRQAVDSRMASGLFWYSALEFP